MDNENAEVLENGKAIKKMEVAAAANRFRPNILGDDELKIPSFIIILEIELLELMDNKRDSKPKTSILHQRWKTFLSKQFLSERKAISTVQVYRTYVSFRRSEMLQ